MRPSCWLLLPQYAFLISTLPCSLISSSEQDLGLPCYRGNCNKGRGPRWDGTFGGGWVGGWGMSKAPRGQEEEENGDSWEASREGVKVVGKIRAVRVQGARPDEGDPDGRARSPGSQ